MSSSSPSERPPNLYFAYGSNLSLTQMAARCPASTYHSLALLPNHKWIINSRGYANVVPTNPLSKPKGPSSASSSTVKSLFGGEVKKKDLARALTDAGFLGEEDLTKAGLATDADARWDEGKDVGRGVYGLLFKIGLEDEMALDLAEGIPDVYEKKMLWVEYFRGEREHVWDEGGLVEALVYVDVKRVEEGVCKEEYVRRINRGVRDAVERGMPGWYVEKVIRRFVREEEVRDEEVVEDPFHPRLIGKEVGGEWIAGTGLSK